MKEPINSFPDFSGSFGDKRIERRASDVLEKLTRGRHSSIRQITETEAEQKSFYRLFNNDSFSEQSIESSIVKRCGQLCTDRHLLCIQDTTEFNLSSSRGRIKPGSGLGQTCSDDLLGFMMHSSLVVDADRSTALGFSYIKLWERREDAPDRHERNYPSQAIEEKESYRWIEAARQSSELLATASAITIIADRESDIYDLLCLADGQKLHVLLRSNSNRRQTNGVKLKDHLDNLPVMHSYDLLIGGDIRKGIAKRKALINLKWDKVSIERPAKRSKADGLPPSKELYIVEASEPGKGIYWRILTTHAVSTAADAISIIDWYKQRWYIEQIHRLLKTDGFRMERSQLEQGWAIRKLTLLAMMATLRILQMMLAYDDDEGQPVCEIFDTQQQQCLEMINRKLEGSTANLKNTANPTTLKWASWIIARLGGWKASKSQRKPGPIVFQKGLVKFYNMFEGWMIFQNSIPNVSTQ